MMEVKQDRLDKIEKESKEEVNKVPKLGEIPEIKEEKVSQENPAGYLCRDTGEVLLDPEEIAYYKVEQQEQIIENLLLGEFDADGKYIIDKPFLEELVKVKKVIREQFEDKYILTSKLSEFGELKFTMQIGNIENGKKVAVLKFVEMFFNFDEDREVFRTYVASYKDDNDQFFIQKVFKVFNIVKQEDYDGLEIDPEKLLLILNRFKTLSMLKTKRIEGVDYISNVYVDEVLAILKKYPCKFSEYVLRKYYEFLKEMSGFVGKQKYFIKLRRFLDKLINSSKNGEPPKDLLDEIKKSREGYSTNYKNIIEPLVAPVIAPKKESKKAVSKSAGGSSGGGGKKKAKAKKKGGAVKKVKSAKKNGKTLGLDTLHLTHPYILVKIKEQEKKVEKKVKKVVDTRELINSVWKNIDNAAHKAYSDKVEKSIESAAKGSEIVQTVNSEMTL